MTPRAKGLDKAARRQVRREELLKVCGELFAQRGVASTTVRDIADAAGILSGSLYYYFDSKEAIVEDILAELLEFMWARYDVVIASSKRPTEKLEGIVEVSLGAIDRFNHAVSIFQNDGPYLAQSERFAFITQRNTEFQMMVTKVIEDGVKSGEFRSDLHANVAFRFIRDSMWPVAAWFRPGGELSIDEVRRDYLAILLGGIAMSPPHAQTV